MSDCKFETYEPGNGSRYELVLVKTKKGLLLVNLTNAGLGGPSFLFNRWRLGGCYGKPDLRYFMEKSGMTNEHDAKALLDRAKAWQEKEEE